MTKCILTHEQATAVKQAMTTLLEAAQDLGNILDETGYKLSDAAPTYVADVDDFNYELMQWSQDETEAINEQTVKVKLFEAS